MLPNCGHHWVTYGPELLGVAAGRYGGALHDGSFDHLKDWINDQLSSLSHELVIGYVPVDGVNDWQYEDHAAQQRLNIDGRCIRTPTMDTLQTSVTT